MHDESPTVMTCTGGVESINKNAKIKHYREGEVFPWLVLVLIEDRKRRGVGIPSVREQSVPGQLYRYENISHIYSIAKLFTFQRRCESWD